MENEAIHLMNKENVEAVQFSMFSLFWRADWVVKLVILILLGCSISCWTVIVQKYWIFLRTKRSALNFEQRFWSGTSIPNLVNEINDAPKNSLEVILICCFEEWKRSKLEIEQGYGERVVTRIASLARSTIDRENQQSAANLSLLASFGSACPFIGLFGTVWGIMNSFTAIAISKQTSLAVVAPGIAEALFATALGLIAAIPATLAYNKFINEIDQQTIGNEQFTTEVLAIFSRQLTK